ncbi:MAG: aminopeptidase N [Acidobacteria bacterium]|nr:aminopeptidase N [Acidobacteriota bacterium]
MPETPAQPHNLTRDEARERARLLSGLRYEVALDLTTGAETFECQATVSFACAEPGASTFVDLFAPEVESATLNGRLLSEEAFDGTRIRLDSLAAGNTLRVVARCAYQRSGVGLHRFEDPVDGAVYLHTQFEPRDAHRVFPCFDQPDLKGPIAMSVVAPAGWEVVSGGRAIQRPAPGAGGLWRFETTRPVSTYLAVVVAGPYHAVHEPHGDINLGLYCRQSLAQYLDPGEIFEITKQGLDFFQSVFDYPYVFGKYDQAFVPEFNSGAMENPGCVTFQESFIFRSKVTDFLREARAGTILHEMAHMWFGDLVTMRWWDDLWLNESFATFMGTLAESRATRFAHSWISFNQQWKAWAYQQDQLPSTHPIVADCPDVQTALLNFDGVTYAKGASVLRQLGAWVGEEAFLAGCRRYFRRHEFANAGLADFLSALEETSGRDLGVWSKEWLETAGVNTLRPVAEVSGDAYRSVAIAQEAPPEWPVLRPHRLAVGLYDAGPEGLVRRRRLELDAVGDRTEVAELAGERVPDLLLVNDEDLAYAKIRLDPRSFETVASRLRDLADPLSRSLCWSSAWDMVRDGELPARDYIRLVLGNVEGEREIGTAQTLLARARSAAVIFGDPERRDAALSSIAEAALAAVRAAEPGGDRQLAWAHALIGAARSAEHLAVLRGILEGGVVIEGLAVDIDLRWSIVRALTAGGVAGEDLIEAEVERDPTDEGRRHAAAARAGRPTAEAKSEAWRAVVEDASLPLATLRAIVGGFARIEQERLLAPYAERYFEVAAGFWESRSPEVALTLSTGLYPGYAISERTLEMTDAYLEAKDPIPPLRRIVLEGRDGVRRALKARACDAAARG